MIIDTQNSTSITVQLEMGVELAPDPKQDSVIYRSYINGGVSVLNYGARQQRTAQIKFTKIPQASYIKLADFLSEWAGKVIQLTPENSGESIFPEYPYGSMTYYYVYVLEMTNLVEEDFSVDDRLYGITLKVALAGIDDPSAIPNEAGDSLIDVLVEIDTTAGATKSGTAPSSPSLGDRWLDTSGSVSGTIFGLFTCTDPDETGMDRWTFMYQLAFSDSDYGWFQGSFYLAAFSTTTIEGTVYKAGLLTYKSVKLPGQSIDINKGPNVSRREGFSIAIDDNVNDEKFWSFIVDQGINLFGANCTIGAYMGGVKTIIRTGINRTNEFSYTDYIFNVDPYTLNLNAKYPSDVTAISRDGVDLDRYSQTKASLLGKSVYITYGQHDKALLQDISSSQQRLIVTRYFAWAETVNSNSSNIPEKYS